MQNDRPHPSTLWNEVRKLPVQRCPRCDQPLGIGRRVFDPRAENRGGPRVMLGRVCVNPRCKPLTARVRSLEEWIDEVTVRIADLEATIEDLKRGEGRS